MVILVAEDDAAIYEVVKIILEGEGYTVFSATNEEEVYASLKEQIPSLLLLDISLSDANGGRITQKLKKSPATKSLPIIIMSANTETEAIAKKSGADGFLLKPFDIDQLIKVAKQYNN